MRPAIFLVVLDLASQPLARIACAGVGPASMKRNMDERGSKSPVYSAGSRAADRSQDRRAFAKILCLNSAVSVVYMTERKLWFGRQSSDSSRPRDANCVGVAPDVTVSRRHILIELATESHSFELTVLGKNGAVVNGRPAYRNGPPFRLPSQSEVVFGRHQGIRLIFLLPCAQNSTVPHKAVRPVSGRFETLLGAVCQVLNDSMSGKLSAAEIASLLALTHPEYARSVGSREVLSSSVVHVISVNAHIFVVHPAADLNANVHGPDVEMMKIKDGGHARKMPALYKGSSPGVKAAKFSVAEEHKNRFVKLNSARDGFIA